MRRHVFLLVPAALIAVLAAGCSPGQSDIEKSVREGMKSTMSVDISSFDLKKQSDGSYLGTATALNGDLYDVTTLPAKNNKMEWKAMPGQSMVEKSVRIGIEQQMSSKVKSLQLTKSGPGIYSGPAELDNGAKVMVTTHWQGTQLLWEAKPIAP